MDHNRGHWRGNHEDLWGRSKGPLCQHGSPRGGRKTGHDRWVEEVITGIKSILYANQDIVSNNVKTYQQIVFSIWFILKNVKKLEAWELSNHNQNHITQMRTFKWKFRIQAVVDKLKKRKHSYTLTNLFQVVQ